MPASYRRRDDGILDDIAIERRMRGDKTIPLTPAERTELVRRWIAAGHSKASLERTAGINPRRYLEPHP